MITKFRRAEYNKSLMAGMEPTHVKVDRRIQAAKDGLFIVVGLLLLLSVYGWVGASDLADAERREAANAKASLQPALDIIGKCVDHKDGLLKIGDEYFMCGTTPIGRYK